MDQKEAELRETQRLLKAAKKRMEDQEKEMQAMSERLAQREGQVQERLAALDLRDQQTLKHKEKEIELEALRDKLERWQVQVPRESRSRQPKDPTTPQPPRPFLGLAVQRDPAIKPRSKIPGPLTPVREKGIRTMGLQTVQRPGEH